MTLIGSSQNLVRPIISSRMMAALLTKMSNRPCSRSICTNNAFTCSSSAWSVRTAIPRPPAAVTIPAVSWIVPGKAAVGRRITAPGHVDDGTVAAKGVRNAGTGTTTGSGNNGN